MAKTKRVLYDGIVFDSVYEKEHYFYFKHHPDFEYLDRQVEFELIPPIKWFDIAKGKKRSRSNMVYTCDFIVKHKDYDKPIVVEIKGYSRPSYKLRMKLFINKYGDEYHFLELGHIKETRKIFGQLKDVDI